MEMLIPTNPTLLMTSMPLLRARNFLQSTPLSVSGFTMIPRESSKALSLALI
jgi:hypothetical protein